MERVYNEIENTGILAHYAAQRRESIRWNITQLREEADRLEASLSESDEETLTLTDVEEMRTEDTPVGAVTFRQYAGLGLWGNWIRELHIRAVQTGEPVGAYHNNRPIVAMPDGHVYMRDFHGKWTTHTPSDLEIPGLTPA